MLVEHTAQQMFDLVDDVESYPKFLPWCGGGDVTLRSNEQTLATLHINYHGIKTHFSTANEKAPPLLMKMRLTEGPFRHLDGEWRFAPLGTSACKIEFRLHYEFSSHLLEKVLGPVFNHIASTFVDAFVKRAQQVYQEKTGNV